MAKKNSVQRAANLVARFARLKSVVMRVDGLLDTYAERRISEFSQFGDDLEATLAPEAVEVAEQMPN